MKGDTCPFCKQHNLMIYFCDVGEGTRYYVHCRYCGAQGPECKESDKAVELWNRREQTKVLPSNSAVALLKEFIKKFHHCFGSAYNVHLWVNKVDEFLEQPCPDGSANSVYTQFSPPLCKCAKCGATVRTTNKYCYECGIEF